MLAAHRKTPHGRPGETCHRWLLVALLVAVVAADQAAKWWAWRYSTDAQLNFGSGPMLGHRFGRWFADPAPGALLDLVDAWLLAATSWVMVSRRWPPVVSIFGVLAVAGWDSNLLDRLGLHYVTAPGSSRGVVDFITLGDNVFNIADFVIVAGTLLLLATLAMMPGRRRPVLRVPFPWTVPRLRSAVAAAAMTAGLVVLVSVGA